MPRASRFHESSSGMFSRIRNIDSSGVRCGNDGFIIGYCDWSSGSESGSAPISTYTMLFELAVDGLLTLRGERLSLIRRPRRRPDEEDQATVLGGGPGWWPAPCLSRAFIVKDLRLVEHFNVDLVQTATEPTFPELRTSAWTRS
jgi:hypothetical protein